MPAVDDAARAGQPGPATRPPRWPAGLAWALLALELLLLAGFLLLDQLVRDAGRPDLTVLGPFAIPPSVAALTAGVVGAVVASRRPRHPVGWLLLAQGMVMWISAAAVGYVPYGLIVRPGALPAANIVARIYPAAIAACLAAVGFVLLLTPTGSPPSPRWRGWARGSAVAVAVTLVAAVVAPGSLDPLAQYVSGPMDPQVYGGALRVANQLALLVGVLTVLAGAGSLVVRFRHARGTERQQLKWVALAAALTGLAMLAAAVLIAAGEVNLGAWASVFGVAFLPVATGAAILRYRLYDVDRIVSRTLAYGLLTVLLGLGYAAVVLGLGRLLPQSSSLAVAAATLAMAAVFQPARRRVQQAVDRRFNRRRHDAARVIEGFGSHLRDQVDLDTLTSEVLAVAEQTMQPTRASLWLRPPPRPGAR
ncbi:MAG: putative two-component system sensor kinase [Actinomycetia bacterium]|nr:putative two-component system sensor kinase [Actinomycetes bacterium]